jgi:hypothetical protein
MVVSTYLLIRELSKKCPLLHYPPSILLWVCQAEVEHSTVSGSSLNPIVLAAGGGPVLPHQKTPKKWSPRHKNPISSFLISHHTLKRQYPNFGNLSFNAPRRWWVHHHQSCCRNKKICFRARLWIHPFALSTLLSVHSWTMLLSLSERN